MKPLEIAQICHEANRAYCKTIGDNSQKSWEEAEQWQKDSAVKGVEFAISNPALSPEAQHEAWLIDKVKAGWKYGALKDATKKEHPCCVPYDQLPVEQQLKDKLFKAIVTALNQ